MRMLLSFSGDLKNNFDHVIFNIFIHILVPYIHVFGMTHDSDITCHKIAPALSMLTKTGSLTDMFMLHNHCITKITSLTASKSATHTASELDSVMLLCVLHHQDTGTPKTYKMNPLTFLLVT